MAIRVGYRQIEAARNVNLIDFLESEYPEHIAYSRKTKEYIHPEHDSLKLFESGFFQFSRNYGGDSIRFLQEYVGLSFQEAVLQLLQFDGSAASDVQIVNVSRKPKTKEAPEKPMPIKSPRNEDLLTYLITVRGIERSTVDMLLEQGVIYQDTKRNVVFINEKTDFALLRGTGEKWQNVWKPGNGYWCFKVGEDPQDVFVTEAPIDAISLYLLRNKTPGVYCAMGGLKPNTFARIVGDYPGYKIRIAPDWDDKGKQFVNSCSQMFKGLVYCHPKAERLAAAGECKDWNELLLAEKEQKERKEEEERKKRVEEKAKEWESKKGK